MLLEENKYAREQFLSNLIRDKNECWLWIGNTWGGYGHFCWESRHYLAHRLMWEYLRGRIYPGLVLHHKCEVKKCSNDEHLELMTPSEHMAEHNRLRAKKYKKLVLPTPIDTAEYEIPLLPAELIQDMYRSLEERGQAL